MKKQHEKVLHVETLRRRGLSPILTLFMLGTMFVFLEVSYDSLTCYLAGEIQILEFLSLILPGGAFSLLLLILFMAVTLKSPFFTRLAEYRPVSYAIAGAIFLFFALFSYEVPAFGVVLIILIAYNYQRKRKLKQETEKE